MALAQIYEAEAGHIITAARWNNEFGNIYDNGTDVAFPVTKAVSFAGFTVTFDAGGVSTITSPANTGFLFTVGNKTGTPSASGSLGSFTASTFTDTATAESGTATLWTGVSIRTPTLASTALTVTTTDAATLYIEGPPTTGTNETITNPWAIFVENGNVRFDGKLRVDGVLTTTKGGDIASASAIAVTVPMADVTGTADINSISTVNPAGAVIKLRFTGAGLNINHNATSFISPWGRDYRTVPNEIIEFLSLGSGNYQFYSVNGPNERVGVTIEANVATAPAGYLDEEQAVSRTTYSGLFAEIGTTFGVGDGATTFDLPASLERVVINADIAGAVARITTASVNGGNAGTLGGVGGAQTHDLATSEMPAHTHSTAAVEFDMATNAGGAVIASNGGSAVTGSTGGGGAHSNTQPWIAKKKFIRF